MSETRETQGRRYAHMCRDEHVEIGHNDSEHELCPVCREILRADTAEATLVTRTQERDSLIAENKKLRQENHEAHAILTGQGEMSWAMTHPDGEFVTPLGKAAAALTADLAQAKAHLEAAQR